MKKKLLLLTCSGLLLFFQLHGIIFAQQASIGTATGVSIKQKNLHDGDIITTTTEGYKLSTIAYDTLLFGVVSFNPGIYLEDKTLPNAIPVVSQGKAKVRVSTINGLIKSGDFITSSTIAGVGQKASENGFVLGTAEESYTQSNPNKIGEIEVTLIPHFAQLSTNISQNLLSTFRFGLLSVALTPLGSLRYILSAALTVLSFYLGFRFFGRTSRSGVEAIGRNPLASRAILVSVAMNVIITVGIMFCGVAIAYIILVL